MSLTAWAFKASLALPVWNGKKKVKFASGKNKNCKLIAWVEHEKTKDKTPLSSSVQQRTKR
ncbi:hypothetical protein D3C84_375850 [compost metagenome]